MGGATKVGLIFLTVTGPRVNSCEPGSLSLSLSLSPSLSLCASVPLLGFALFPPFRCFLVRLLGTLSCAISRVIKPPLFRGYFGQTTRNRGFPASKPRFRALTHLKLRYLMTRSRLRANGIDFGVPNAGRLWERFTHILVRRITRFADPLPP